MESTHTAIRGVEDSVGASEKQDLVNESTTAIEHIAVVDVKADKALLRKIDLHVLPPLFALYLLTFLDRTNIGNARIQGLTEDLNMKGHDYNLVLMIFFIPYTLFEIPSNLILKRVAPSTWLSVLVTLWGACTIGAGLVTTQGGLIAMRFLIGVFEAGFLPGATYLMSMYYSRYELQIRYTIFLCASTLAGSVGGLFAYALAKLDGTAGYRGWRWIFILEGLITVVIAVVSKRWLPDWPEAAKFLTQDERSSRSLHLRTVDVVANMDRLDKRAVNRIFADWKIYVCTLMYFGVVTAGNSIVFFIPTILHAMGYTAAMSQVRTIPIYVVTAAVALANSYASDRARHRYGFTLFPLGIALIGYVIMLCQRNVTLGIQYMACFFATAGSLAAMPTVMVWLPNNVSGHYKRSISSGFQLGFGGLGGILATNVYVASEAPYFYTGYWTTIGMILLCAVSATALLIGLVFENRKRANGERDYRLQLEDADNLGDDHPNFRFCY